MGCKDACVEVFAHMVLPAGEGVATKAVDSVMAGLLSLLFGLLWGESGVNSLEFQVQVGVQEKGIIALCECISLIATLVAAVQGGIGRGGPVCSCPSPHSLSLLNQKKN